MHSDLVKNEEDNKNLDREIDRKLKNICFEISTIALADTHITCDRLIAEFEKEGIDLINILRVCARKFEGD